MTDHIGEKAVTLETKVALLGSPAAENQLIQQP